MQRDRLYGKLVTLSISHLKAQYIQFQSPFEKGTNEPKSLMFIHLALSKIRPPQEDLDFNGWNQRVNESFVELEQTHH